MVRVLVLVYEHVLELPLVVLQHVGVLVEKAHGVVDEVFKVHGSGLEQAGGVGGVYLADLALARVGALAVFRGVALGREQLVLGRVYHRQDAARRVDLLVEIHLAQDGLHHAVAVRGVVDGEVARIAQLVRVAAQYAHAGAVEGARPDVVGLGAELGGKAAFQLVRGLVREGDGDDAPRLHRLVGSERLRLRRGTGLEHGQVGLRGALGHLVTVGCASVFEQVGDAVYEHGGLSAACPCEDEQRPLRGHNSLALHGVQVAEIIGNDAPSCGDISLLKVIFHSETFYHIATGYARAV